MDFLTNFKCNLLNFKATFYRGAGFDISCELSTYVSGYCASYVRMFYYAKLLYAMLRYVMLCLFYMVVPLPVEEFSRYLSWVFYFANDSTKENTVLLFILECLVEDFRPSSRSSKLITSWQLLEDLKSSVCVFSCAGRFAVAAAATRIIFVAEISQPGAVRTVREFETHHVTILHRVPIISVLGVDLKGGVGIGQPGASCHGTDDSTNTTSLKWVHSQGNRSWNSLRDMSIYWVIKRTKIILIDIKWKSSVRKRSRNVGVFRLESITTRYHVKK